MEETRTSAGPALCAQPHQGWLGSLAGTGRIIGDIVSPAVEEADWDALRD